MSIHRLPARSVPTMARIDPVVLGLWGGALLLHALFWVSLRTAWLTPLFNDTTHRFGPGADFFALYQAGYNALQGRSLYHFLPGETVIPYGYPFRYLPVVAYTVGALLTRVAPPTAYALWLGLCELCLLHNLRLTWRRAGGGRRGAGLALAWLGFSPFFVELWMGQFTFLLGSLLFWSVLAWEERRAPAAQGWWLVSVLYKPAGLLWAPLWLREGRFALLGLCGALLLANLVYFLCFPADWPLFWETNVSPLPTWHAGNVGLSGLLYHFTASGPLFRPLRTGLSLLLLAPLLWVTFHRPQAPFWRLAALWTCLYFLVYKDVWEHHLTLLLPFLVLGLARAPTPLLVGLTALLALPSPFFFYDLPHLGYNVDPQPLFSPAVSLLHHAWRVLPLLVLYGHWLVQTVRGEEERPQGSVRAGWG